MFGEKGKQLMPPGRRFLPGEVERLTEERRLRQLALKPKEPKSRARTPRVHQAGVLPTPQERALATPTEWRAVDSSRVRDARYDTTLHQLHVHFKDGTPWVYREVPQNVWNNFKRSSSPGRFINRVLNEYPYHKGAGF